MAPYGKVDRGRIEIREDECKGCGLCVLACPPEVVTLTDCLNARGYHPASYVGSGCTGAASVSTRALSQCYYRGTLVSAPKSVQTALASPS